MPDDFRFVVKAQRGASLRAMRGPAAGPIDWLTAALPVFGPRLGGVLFRVPGETARDDVRLGAVLDAWPRRIPLIVELQHPSWQRDESFALLRAAGAVLCTTDLDPDDGTDPAPPDIRRTGPFLYLRLRRTAYGEDDLDQWARRLVPFLEDGMDAFVMFRHDGDGTSALHAEGFASRVERARAGS